MQQQVSYLVLWTGKRAIPQNYYQKSAYFSLNNTSSWALHKDCQIVCNGMLNPTTAL